MSFEELGVVVHDCNSSNLGGIGKRNEVSGWSWLKLKTLSKA
jgi:hypothetical protein